MKKKQKKWLIITGIIVAVLFIIILTFDLIVSSIIESKVRAFLKDKKPIKGYNLTFDKIRFNILNRSVNLIDLKIMPDSIFVKKLVESGYKSSLVNVELKKLSVTGIQFEELIKNKKIIVKNIKFKKPLVKIYLIKGKEKPKEKRIEKNEKLFVALEDSVKIKGINGLKIELLNINRGEFDIIDYKTNKKIIVNDNIDILVRNITLLKSKYNDDYLYPEFENASLTIENNTIKTGNKLYELGFETLNINFKGKFLEVKNFRYKPNYSKKQFSKHIKWQQERYDIKVKDILVSDIDFKRLIITNVLHINKVEIDKASIKLFRDKNVPFDHSRRPLLPQQALKRLKFNMKIDSILFSDTYFEYEELPKKSKHKNPIHIHLSKISGVLTNVNTIKSELTAKDEMKLKGTLYLMDKAKCDINFVFPLTAKNDVFYFSASIKKPFDLKIINKAIYPAVGMKFESGIVDELTLHGTGFPTFAHGRFKMLYHDLKMAAIDKDGVTNKKTISWGVNRFVSVANPKKGKEPIETVMFFERDMEKGFGNFFWKTIYSGLKGTIIPLFQKQSARKFEKFVKAQQQPQNNKTGK